MLQCANIGPADFNYDETISTLRYANRAKNIKNRARVNEDPKDALLRQFQCEIEELRKQLEAVDEPHNGEPACSELSDSSHLVLPILMPGNLVGDTALLKMRTSQNYQYALSHSAGILSCTTKELCPTLSFQQG